MNIKKIIKKIMKSRVFFLVEVLLFISVCFGIGATIAYVEHGSDPTDIAAEYFRAFAAGDYGTMYKLAYKNDDIYIDEEMFRYKIEKIRTTYQIDSYDIKKTKTVDGKKVVTVKCMNDSNKKSKDFNIAIHSERHFPSIIPEFAIDISDMEINDVSIVTFKGNDLLINGTKITDKNSSISEDGNKITYTFDSILQGNTTVSSTNDDYANLKTVKVKKNEQIIDLTKGKLTTNANDTVTLNKLNDKIFKAYYAAVRDRKPSSSKLSKLIKNKKVVKKIKKSVEKSEDIVFWPDTRNIEMYKVIDMTFDGDKTSIKYDKKTKKYTLTHKYNYSYQSATDTALYTSYIYLISGKAKSTMTLEFKKNKGKFKVVNFKISEKNKKDD